MQHPGGNHKRRRRYRSQPPGIAGGKSHKDGQERRARERREADPRIQRAREEQAANEAMLQALIDASLIKEAEASVRLDGETQVLGPVTVLPEVRPEEPEHPASEAAEVFLAAPRTPEAIEESLETLRKREQWSLSQARDLLKQGYTLESTVARTGWTAEQITRKDRS